MMRERVRFQIDLDRQTDVEFKKLAVMEHRSKRNMHAVLLQRVLRAWRENPDQLRELKLIQD